MGYGDEIPRILHKKERKRNQRRLRIPNNRGNRMKCKTCNKELTVITGIGYAHNTKDSETCPEDDGIRIHSTKRKGWDEKYGIPKDTIETIVSRIQLLKKENALLKDKKQQITEFTNELIEERSILQEEILEWETKTIRKLLKRKARLLKKQYKKFTKKNYSNLKN